MNNKLQDIVLELNGEFYENVAKIMGEKDEILAPFECSSNGYTEGILFLGISIWDDNNNSRFDSDDNEMDLKGFVLDEVKKLMAQINCFKL